MVDNQLMKSWNWQWFINYGQKFVQHLKLLVPNSDCWEARVASDLITIWIMVLGINQSHVRVVTHWCSICYRHWIIECLQQLTFPGTQIHSSHAACLGTSGCKEKGKNGGGDLWSLPILIFHAARWHISEWRNRQVWAGDHFLYFWNTWFVHDSSHTVNTVTKYLNHLIAAKKELRTLPD